MVKYIGKKTTIADGTAVMGELKDITGPDIKIAELETTVYDTTTWRTFSAGLKDGGTVGIVVFYDGADASMNRMYLRAIADPSLNTDTYTITLPDGKTMIFTGIIVGVPISIPIDENILMTFSLKVSGAITGTLGT